MPNKKKRDVFRKCERLEKHISVRDLATEDEIAEYRPADAQEDATKTEWWQYLCQLHRFLGREDWMPKKSEQAEEEMLKGLREEPEPVTSLVSPGVRELEGERVFVYPKGLDALLWMNTYDEALKFMSNRKDALEIAIEEGYLSANDVRNPWSVIQQIDEEIGHHLAVMGFAATREGPHFDGLTKEEIGDPPDEWLNIDPVDLVQIHRKFVEVNAERMTLLPYLSGPQKQSEGEDRASWSVFISNVAGKRGDSAKEVARNESLVSQLIQTNLSAPDLEDLDE